MAQISLAVALVIGAALMSKGMNSLLHVADGYNPSHVLTFRVTLPDKRYDTPQKMAAWYRDSLAKLRALPGVTHAEVVAARCPTATTAGCRILPIENRPVTPGKFQSAIRDTVSEGYFSAFHIPIVAGRGFNASDALTAQPVAVVSRRFVERYFPSRERHRTAHPHG